MALLDIRQRTGYLLLAVILGHVILISAQVNSRSGVPILETVTFGVFAEVQRGMSVAVTAVRDVWTGYVDLRHAKVENDALKRQLGDAQIELEQQRALAARSQQLEKLLALRDQSALTTTAAEIIAGAATPDFQTVTIDKGTRDGLHSNLAVVAPAGVVGRVVKASGRAAKVQLLIDRNAAAAVVIERSRAQGVVVGTGEEHLRMEYVAEVADIMKDDVVVTSGIDGIYPKGFVVGRVESVEKSGVAYKRIVVKPTVDFRSLEEVLVVLTPATPQDAVEEGRE
jgi:rod shape-determining protein MreC